MYGKRNDQTWHGVVKLREDVKSGEPTLAMFAADLYDVKLQQPQNVPVPVTPPPVVSKPGIFTAEGEIQSQEFMDLADSLGEVLKAAVPNTLRLNVRIELGGEPKASESKVKAINALLAKVKKGLELK